MRRLLLCLLSALVSGCAFRFPDHVAVTGKHTEAETTGGLRTIRTRANEIGVTATYDFQP